MDIWDAFRPEIGWRAILVRTAKEFVADDCPSLAAQLAYYFFLALFPALLFALSLASFFPIASLGDELVAMLRPFAPPDVLEILRDQMARISNADNSGILTIGFLGALWSSSSAMTSIVSTLNRAYDITEGRSWIRVRLLSIALTGTLTLFILISFTLIVAGPELAETVAAWFGLGPVFEWSWKILQWPIVFMLMTTAVGLVFYAAPDAEQVWEWITPGALLATSAWLLLSLGFRVYIINFTDYNATYGSIGAVIVLLLWFYASSLALLAGAELNAELEHASPYGKDPGEKQPGERRKIGRLAREAYRRRTESGERRLQPQG